MLIHNFQGFYLHVQRFILEHDTKRVVKTVVKCVFMQTFIENHSSSSGSDGLTIINKHNFQIVCNQHYNIRQCQMLC